MRPPPRVDAPESERGLPFPIETLRFWYVSPFGGRSTELAADQVGVNRDALTRNTELRPDDRVTVGLPGADPERPVFFVDTFVVVSLDATRPGAAELSPNGEVVLPDAVPESVGPSAHRLRLGDPLVLKGTAAIQFSEPPEWLRELLARSVRRPNF